MKAIATVGLVGLGVGVGSAVASDDCYYVRSRTFVPGYGVVVKRRLVCD